MARLLILSWVCAGLNGVSIAGAKNEQLGTPGWGSVVGRVVFGGDLNAPILNAYQKDVEIFYPRPLLENPRRTIQVNGRRIQFDQPSRRPRVLATAANRKLILDPKTKGIKNAIAYLRTRRKRVHPSFEKHKSRKPIELIAHDRLFSPRVFTLYVGQSLKVISKETKFPQTVKSLFYRNDNFFENLHGEFVWTPKKHEFFPLRIIGSWRSAAIAYCLITDHPYSAVTTTDGSFRLDNLPAGEHELYIWHEELGYIAKKLPIRIMADQVLSLSEHKITAERLDEANR